MEPEIINAEIDSILLRKEDSDWSILNVTLGDGRREKLVGITHAQEGMSIRAEGKWERTKYGYQFTASAIHVSEPSSVDGIVRYLGSGMIKGIGKKTAKTIVTHFGEDTLKILDDEPARLREVPGIGKAKSEKIIASWIEQRSVAEIMLFLAEHHVSPALARKIYKQYGAESITVVRTQPYRLANDMEGVGFKIADRVARDIGIPFDSPERIEACLIYLLRESRKSGNCGIELDRLIRDSVSTLSGPDGRVGRDQVASIIDRMTEETSPRLVLVDRDDEVLVYLTRMWYLERNVAKRILNLSVMPTSWAYRAREAAKVGENAQGLPLGDAQKSALVTLLKNSMAILTGGPGTGKTSTLKALLASLKHLKVRYHLAAPTGKAAKRMEEATGEEAMTIHRLLGIGTPEEKTHIDGDILILDESSMVDIELMHTVVKSVEGKALILVGDFDQLPSVGPGQVLRDMIESGVVTTAKLDKTYRQSKHSKIAVNAARINSGEMPLEQNRDDDFLFVQIGEDETDVGKLADDIAEWIVNVMCSRLPSTYGLDPLKDIMVLSPMRKHGVGVTRLNQLIQERLNPEPSDFRMRGEIRLGVGDKVIQTRNNYDLNIFNGDVGFIESMNKTKEVMNIQFDSGLVPVPFENANDLDLAYAMTIHKSQGSEAKAVIIPMSTQHYNMLNRNLLYTGVTRAKQLLILAGQRRALRRAVSTRDATRRITMLKHLLIKG